MIEHIGTTGAMQTGKLQSAQSAKPAEAAKAQDVSEKEQAAVQTEPRKRDRFERSGEVSYAAGSPDDPKAREAFDAKQNAEKADNSRSFDRAEFSSKYVSDTSDAQLDEVSSEEAESVDTNKLYQYTDTELKDFLLDGSITQSEYDAEIAKRAV